MKLFFEETGRENEETIIFLHAEGFSGWMWDEQINYFKNYHLIVPDLPEHGKSHEVKPFTIQGAAEMVMELIEDHADGRANLVGISLGAQIIIQILSKAPEMVDHALISGTLVRGIQNTESLMNLLNNIINTYGPVKNTDFFIKAYMRTYNISKTYFNKFKDSTYQIDNLALERVLREKLLYKLPEHNAADTKVLIMAGEKDYGIIKDSSRSIVNKYPNYKAFLALKTGHLWNLESPENFNSILNAWLNDEPLPRTISSKLD